MVARAGIPIVDVPFVTVGGGIGSFVTVDYLRIAGVPASSITGARRHRQPVVDLRVPDPGLADPARASGCARTPPPRPTTSGASRPTPCARRWPRGACKAKLAAAVERAHRADLRRLLHPAGRPGLRALEREAERIGYGDCSSRAWSGWSAGAPAAATSPSSRRPRAPSPTKRVAFRSRYVHVAVGYPGLKFLPDLQRYRETYQDYHTSSTPTSRTSTSTRSCCASPARSWCAAAASWPRGCCSG